MHQYKELIDDINVKYIEMPNKLECLISGNDLYINERLSSSAYIRETSESYYSQSNKVTSLIPLNQIENAVITHNCTTLLKLSKFFKLPTTFIFLNLYFYSIKYSNLSFLNIFQIKRLNFNQIDT
ncbi:hypothetical protein K4U34_07985 [Staphylococcus epidermidis]|uniref:hypothetical protein n=1 Tax=Staphylococcus epidermidis TaxID=1282 RepID=UPI00098B0F9A|nr:hypothetical protein [Staphylococcus epidermidis]KAB2175237.1 hypothetical protein F9B30_05835 [Staphylococcus epidermidis]MCG1598661.1 hypothetical protein [Staphylococcus epidermidis]MCG1609719.1 hypothetical protein [Staphylococcus epidermidis]MCG1625457.1 hypothetical protein [Staphylococcus epidermidis]MCG2251657.1 hypothetical protein [Staphylococcus epidermidis]